MEINPQRNYGGSLELYQHEVQVHSLEKRFWKLERFDEMRFCECLGLNRLKLI